MTTRPYELLARFNADGTIGGAHVRTLTVDNGRAAEDDPIPLANATDPAFIAFADQFAAKAVAELEATKSELADLQKQLSTANARIVELQNSLPWDRRIIDATAFVARIAPVELLDLADSTDPTRQQITQMLLAYKKNDWPILLDSPEMQQAIGYLVQSGAISRERSIELLMDSSQAEAYKAGD